MIGAPASTVVVGDAPAAGPARVAVRLELSCEERINLALQQTGLPVVHELVVQNVGDVPLEQVRCVLSVAPELAPPITLYADRLGVGHALRFERQRLELSPERLARLDERFLAALHVEVFAAEDRVAVETWPLEVLAPNEWQGLTALPELIAAFVMPNSPALVPWLRTAADLLGKWTGDPALNGYQSRDEERVRAMAAAVYGAFQRADITYVSPPASFELEGQKVRSPAEVAAGRMGTCLDLAVTAAACLEQCGLHPLIVIVQGHALTGVWLGDDRFPEPAQGEPLKVLKRVELGEIAVFDPTAATSRDVVGYEQAEQLARAQLAKVESFVCAVDVRTSRLHGVRPLPSGGDAESVAEGRRDYVTAAPAPDAAILVSRRIVVGETAPREDDDVAVRLDRWRSKLLDMSLRNRLLNHRDGKGSIEHASVRRGEVVIHRQRFLWTPSVDPVGYAVFRMPVRDTDGRREAADIPPEEIANAAHALLTQGGATPAEGLVRDVARLFGFSRVGSRVETAMSDGITVLVATGRASREGELLRPSSPADAR